MSDAVETQAKKFEKRRLNNHVYELLPESSPDLEVVFVPGLLRQGMNRRDAVWRTWKMRDSEDCWPEILLPQLLQIPTWDLDGSVTRYKPRVLSVSYENKVDLGPDGRGNGATDPYLIIENLMHDLIIDAGVGQKGVPVFFVGHDLGGILTKKFVLKVEGEAAVATLDVREKLNNFLSNLKSVFFFCTPHYGAEAFGALKAKLHPKDANQMLCLMEMLYNKTARINMDFQNYRRGEPESQGSIAKFSTHVFYAAHETHEGGFHALVVPEGTARSDADTFYPVKANHFTACQPENLYSSQVNLICRQMISILTRREATRR